MRSDFTRSSIAVLFGLLVLTGDARALGTAFTYQGQLEQSGALANDTCDFQFSLFDALSAGNQVGPPQTLTPVSVTDGLFTVPLDFGSTAFDGNDRWLQIAVRCPAGPGSYTTLTPRQPLTAAPYALYASAAGSVSWSGLTGLSCVGGQVAKWNGSAWMCAADDDTTYTAGSGLALGGNQFSVNTALIQARVTGTCGAGSSIRTINADGTVVCQPDTHSGGTVTSITAGAGLTGGTITMSGTIAANIGTGAGTVAAGNHNHDAAYWKLGGNTGTTPGTNFLGTTDSQALEIQVNGQRALRIEPNPASPNLIGGYAANSAATGVEGGTVSGGGNSGDANRVTDDYGTVCGGLNNAAASNATVGGGDGNTAGGDSTTVAGGAGNTVMGQYSTIGGGAGNSISARLGTIAGGGLSDLDNPATANRVTADYGTIGGGGHNTAGGRFATVGGGDINVATGEGAVVGGGGGNNATDFAAVVGGGYLNVASGEYSTVPGGYGNLADGEGSLAAGRNAHANHPGSFVWGDGTQQANSIGTNSFAVLAQGGAGFYVGGGSCVVTNPAFGWSCTSDRNLKENLTPVDARDVLQRVHQLPIATWSGKGADPQVRHIGPMAQDFYAAFQVGDSDTHINTVDASGVALAAIQGLQHVLQDKQAQISALREQLAALQQQHATVEARLAVLEQALQRQAATAPISDDTALNSN